MENITKQVIENIKSKKYEEYEWYSIRSLMGNSWAFFYIMIGGREAGKSYAVMKHFVKEWKLKGKPFTWLRLTEASTKKLLSNNADKFVDADIRRKYGLKLSVKGCQVYDDGKPMAKILALSTFYSDKGVALYDNEYDLGYNIALDEFQREKGERNTFDITYAFVNQMENLVRSTKDNVRIFIIGNTLETASDLLVCFNFIPEKFGRYYVKKKRAVVDYIKPSKKYLDRRKGSVADLLTPDVSNFTNKIDVDKSRISKKQLKRPTAIIKFSKSKNEWFVVWDGNLIRKWNKENIKNVIAMTPFLDEVFSTENRDQIINIYNNKGFWFRDLITQKRFTKYLMLLLHKS